MKRGEVWIAALDPTLGSEFQKARPCLVVSPPELNDHLRTIIVAPMTTGSRPARYRMPITFAGTKGLVLLDQLRTLDKMRLIKRMGTAPAKTLNATLVALCELFAP